MTYLPFLLTLLLLTSALRAQPFPVIDQEAIAKSGENLAANLTKAYQHGRILHFTEAIDESYTAIVTLQQQVLEDMKQAESVADLHWSDLSKSVYLATELVKGAVQPGIEVEYVIEHPLFQRHPNDTYRQLFVADGSVQLPANLASLRRAKQNGQSLSDSFRKLAAERKTYAGVAYQYLSEDLLLKATEMNEVLRQPERFSMTEAERLRLQTFAEDYLLLAGQLLERSDALLLDVTRVKPLQQAADQQQQKLERTAIARTPVLDY